MLTLLKKFRCAKRLEAAPLGSGSGLLVAVAAFVEDAGGFVVVRVVVGADLGVDSDGSLLVAHERRGNRLLGLQDRVGGAGADLGAGRKRGALHGVSDVGTMSRQRNRRIVGGDGRGEGRHRGRLAGAVRNDGRAGVPDVDGSGGDGLQSGVASRSSRRRRIHQECGEEGEPSVTDQLHDGTPSIVFRLSLNVSPSS